MQPEKINIGLILDSKNIELWKCKIIENLIDEKFIKLDFIFLFSNKTTHNKTNTLLTNYIEWDKDYNKEHEDSLDIIDLYSIINNSKIKILNEDKDVEKERVHIIVHLADAPIKNNFLRISKYGIWVYNFGGYDQAKNETKYFWEIFNRDSISIIYLICYCLKYPKGKIIYKSITNTNLFSFYKNINNIFLKSPVFISRMIRYFYENGFESLEKLNFSIDRSKNITHQLSNITMINFHLKLFFREVNKIFRKQFYNQEWQIILKYKSKKSLLKPPTGRWYADPFPVKEKDSIYLFFEDFIKREGKGCISFVEIENNKISEPFEVLKEKFHLSYPHVFKDNNEYYMIPETMEDNSIRLYKSINFPKKWEFKKTLISNVSAVDSTTLFYKNKVWLFTNIAKNGASDWEELYLFYSDSILGEWHSHPLNPIISDVTKARPAGKIFINEQGALIRPSQDCSKCYGYAINLNKITKISTKEYEEVQEKKILPIEMGNYFGTHTYNKIEDFYFFDAKKWVKNKNYNLLKFMKNIFGIYHHKPIRSFLFHKIKNLLPSKLS